MLGRANRFHGQRSLKNVYNRGQNVRGQMIGLKFTKRDPSKPYRVAVVVSRKVNKSAVQRNRIRRRLYEAVRQSKQPIKGGTDMVFTVFVDQLATISATKLQTTVDDLLRKAASHQQTPVKRAIVEGKD